MNEEINIEEIEFKDDAIKEVKDIEHHFKIRDAMKYGIIKAILLYNFRFWLEKNKANKTNINKHTDGKEYYWTFNSVRAFGELFPYIKEQTIARHLAELEKKEVLISGIFNKINYDKTKWYSMKEYKA